jgi:hypothetical protein
VPLKVTHTYRSAGLEAEVSLADDRVLDEA